MVRTINHVTGSPDGSKSKGGKTVTIVHLKLGKITKRSDGRYQAGYKDLDGKRKFITCNTEAEVLKRFQTIHLSAMTIKDNGVQRGKPKKEAASSSPKGTLAIPEENLLLANCMLNWLEKYKLGKVHPTSYARYSFCLQLLCKDELAHMDIPEIKLEHIQEYINRLKAELSASTIKKQKLMLSQVL